jgi:hypothetical protein
VRTENLAYLLQRAPSRFDEEKVDEDEFEYIPEDEEEVVLSQ